MLQGNLFLPRLPERTTSAAWKAGPFYAPFKLKVSWKTGDLSPRAGLHKGEEACGHPGLEGWDWKEASTSASMKDQKKLRHSHTHPRLALHFRIPTPTVCSLLLCRQQLCNCTEPLPGFEAQVPAFLVLTFLPNVTHSLSLQTWPQASDRCASSGHTEPTDSSPQI